LVYGFLQLGELREISKLIDDRLKKAIVLTQDDVFLRSEFARFGSSAQLSRALRHLFELGTLVKLGVGVYAKAKPSALSGKPIPVKPLEVLAPLVLQKLGVKVSASQAVLDYNSGRSTQLAAGIVQDTGRRRICRKLSFGERCVSYENHYA
jgi:hypothetical protein